MSRIKVKKLHKYLKKQKNLTEFEHSLLNDWGKEDVWGPWHWGKKRPRENPGTFKFYKSYYIIS